MSRTGKVVSNLMIDLNPSNIKLRDSGGDTGGDWAAGGDAKTGGD